MANNAGSTDDAQPADAEKQDDLMLKVAKQFGMKDRDGRGAAPVMSPGDRAALRRMEVTRVRSADGAVIKLLLAADIPKHLQTRDFDRWRLIAHIAAMLSGTGKLRAHARGRKLGAILREADYSENRLLRLLSVRGAALDGQVRRAMRVIAQKGKQPIDLWTVYDLVGPNPDRAEAARIRIAQDYYAATAAADKGDVE